MTFRGRAEGGKHHDSQDDDREREERVDDAAEHEASDPAPVVAGDEPDGRPPARPRASASGATVAPGQRGDAPRRTRPGRGCRYRTKSSPLREAGAWRGVHGLGSRRPSAMSAPSRPRTARCRSRSETSSSEAAPARARRAARVAAAAHVDRRAGLGPRRQQLDRPSRAPDEGAPGGERLVARRDQHADAQLAEPGDHRAPSALDRNWVLARSRQIDIIGRSSTFPLRSAACASRPWHGRFFATTHAAGLAARRRARAADAQEDAAAPVQADRAVRIRSSGAAATASGGGFPAVASSTPGGSQPMPGGSFGSATSVSDPRRRRVTRRPCRRGPAACRPPRARRASRTRRRRRRRRRPGRRPACRRCRRP